MGSVRSKRMPSTLSVAEDLDGRVVEVQVQTAARARRLARAPAVQHAQHDLELVVRRVRRVGVDEVLVVHDDVDVRHLAELAQLDGRELDVGGPAAAEDVHVGDGGCLEAREHVVGDLGGAEVDRVLREHARDVERDVAVADDGDLALVERPLGGHVGVPVEPGHEVGGAVRARQVDARDVERGVADGAGRDDHGVVALLQLVERDVAADLDVADEARGAGIQHLVQRVDDALDAGVVGRDAVADQAVRRRKRLEQVDRHGSAGLDDRVGEDVAGVDAGGTGADDRDAEVPKIRGGHSARSGHWVGAFREAPGTARGS